MKSYTDIPQSKKLAEILPIKSADNYYSWHDEQYYIVNKDCPYPYSLKEKIPCWSLAALLNYLKSKNKFPEIGELSDGRFKLTTYIWDGENSIQVSIGDTIVDACYELILKLHKLNLL